ncbi:MAG: hypothetical protein AB7O80_13795 [Acetobacteraceae bacterium]
MRTPLLAALLLFPLASASALAQSQVDKQKTLQQGFDALKMAPSEEVAGALEARIRRLQLEAGTAAVTLLMSRGLRELAAGQHDDAIEAFTDAIVLEPDMSEAYHQRAIARFKAGDSLGAVRDIEEALRREPRSFAALRTLTDIAAARDDWKSAYAAWEKLLEIDPKTPNGEERLKELKRRAFGQEA